MSIKTKIKQYLDANVRDGHTKGVLLPRYSGVKRRRIDIPKVGMRVFVDDSKHCFFSCNSSGGGGVIEEVDSADSFLVRMDEHPDEARYRCRECVSEIYGRVI